MTQALITLSLKKLDQISSNAIPHTIYKILYQSIGQQQNQMIWFFLHQIQLVEAKPICAGSKSPKDYFSQHLPSKWRCSCFFNSDSWLNELGQILHLYLNSSCILRWVSKWVCCKNFSSHFVHSNGYCRPCVFMCVCSCDCCLNVFSGQRGQ